MNNTKRKLFKCRRCPICYDPILNILDKSWTRCGHIFHKTCLDKWKEVGDYTCPVCQVYLRWSHEEDTVSAELKKNPKKYAGFQLWCLQKKLDKHFIKSAERNRYYCFKMLSSPMLKRRYEEIKKLNNDEAFDLFILLFLVGSQISFDNF